MPAGQGVGVAQDDGQGWKRLAGKLQRRPLGWKLLRLALLFEKPSFALLTGRIPS
jgi:hypothetical protein